MTDVEELKLPPSVEEILSEIPDGVKMIYRLALQRAYNKGHDEGYDQGRQDEHDDPGEPMRDESRD